jgi:hypothetical protein
MLLSSNFHEIYKKYFSNKKKTWDLYYQTLKNKNNTTPSNQKSKNTLIYFASG